MHLVTVILGVLLFPKALSALTCYDCTEALRLTGACTEVQTDCPASQQCGASAVRTSLAGINVEVKVKSCLPSASCGLSGSMNVGMTKTSTVSQCCSTALCNVHYPTPPSISATPNGKRCYTCEGDTCSTILSCSGGEDRCISTRVEFGGSARTVKGCVSKSLCVSSSGADTHAIPGVSATVSCCEGDLCNSATSTAVSLLLLAAAVLSFALFN